MRNYAIYAAIFIAILASSSGKAAPKTDAPISEERKRLLAPEDNERPIWERVADETLLKVNVSRDVNEQNIPAAETMRRAAGYAGADNRSRDNAYTGGMGFVSQGWNTGSNAQAQGATSMTAQFGWTGAPVTITRH